MRYGHSAINPIILRLDDNWDPIPAGHLVVRDAITNPLPVLEEGIEPVLRGIVAQVGWTSYFGSGKKLIAIYSWNKKQIWS